MSFLIHPDHPVYPVVCILKIIPLIIREFKLIYLNHLVLNDVYS